MEERRCWLDSFLVVVFHFMSRMDIPRIILRQRMRKLSRRWTCGSSRTVHSNPYSSVGMITEVKTRNLVLIRILCWSQRIRLSEWNAEEALHIFVSTSSLTCSCPVSHFQGTGSVKQPQWCRLKERTGWVQANGGTLMARWPSL